MTTETKEKAKVHYLPEGRVINSSLFERDSFGDKGEPKYKVELAFDPKQLEEIENDMAAEMEAAFGKKVGDDWFNGERYCIKPMLDGNRLAADREAKGKDGTAYKGKLIIRTDTAFNADGQKAAGGIQVFDENAKRILVDQKGLIYPGMYGIAAVTFYTYKDYPRSGDRAIKCYLSAFQRTRGGEKLSTGGDKSSLFKPVGGAPAAGAVRRQRG